MADQQEIENDELEGISDEDAKRLLESPPGEGKDSDKTVGERSATDSTDWKSETDRWKKFSRKNEDELKSVRAKLKEYEDKDKTESQRLQEERDSLKAELETTQSRIRRREAAEDYAPEHATQAQIRAAAKYINGGTDEELKAAAEEFYALIAPAPTKTPVSKPKERLRGGGDPDDGPDETDPRKLAALIPRAR